jgi:hypothetical protein
MTTRDVGHRSMRMINDTSGAEEMTTVHQGKGKMVLLVRSGEGEGEKMEWVHLREGLRHLKIVFLYRREGERLQDGTFMLQATSSIPHCRLSKLVYTSIDKCCSYLTTFTGLFNLPGANRTQIPPILGIAGLPPPMPVPTFGMGMGVNPNLSRQSRRLYIGSITPEINEQNLADFFNAKMAEMNIGTGAPGNPVLAVQCNYEKNYAFIEVGFSFCIYTGFYPVFLVPKCRGCHSCYGF